MNRYAYAGNDPINRSDPEGHESEVLAAAFGIGAAAACAASGVCGAIVGGIILGIAIVGIAVAADSITGEEEADESPSPLIGHNGGPPLDEEDTEPPSPDPGEPTEGPGAATASNSNYRQTFAKASPSASKNVVVHHAIE